MTARVLNLTPRLLIVAGALLAASCLAELRPFQSAARDRQTQDQTATERGKQLDEAADLNDQVLQLFERHKYNEAIPLAKRVLEIRARLLPPDDVRIATANFNLGELYMAEKHENDAQRVFELALAAYEAHSEQNGLAIAKTLERLGYVQFLNRDYSSADPLYSRSLIIREKELGAKDPVTITAMKNYGCLSLMSGAYGKVEDPVRDLRRRAICWAGELTEDCAEEHALKNEGYLNAKALKLKEPHYPPAAQEKRLSGKIFVAILIDEAGNVIKARTICGGTRALNGVAVDAARASRFIPATNRGQPIKISGVIVYNFVGYW